MSASVQWDFSPSHRRNKGERGPDEQNVSIARRSAGIRARGHTRTPQIPNHFLDISHIKSTNPSEACTPSTAATTLFQPDHGLERSPSSLENNWRFVQSCRRPAANSLAKCPQRGAILCARTTAHNSPGRHKVERSSLACSRESEHRARLCDAAQIIVYSCLTYRSNVFPLLEASRNRHAAQAGDKARTFRLSENLHTRNRATARP